MPAYLVLIGVQNWNFVFVTKTNAVQLFSGIQSCIVKTKCCNSLHLLTSAGPNRFPTHGRATISRIGWVTNEGRLTLLQNARQVAAFSLSYVTCAKNIMYSLKRYGHIRVSKNVNAEILTSKKRRKEKRAPLSDTILLSSPWVKSLQSLRNFLLKQIKMSSVSCLKINLQILSQITSIIQVRVR